jgi:hypothetical protein
MGQTTKPAHDAARCDGLASGTAGSVKGQNLGDDSLKARESIPKPVPSLFPLMAFLKISAVFLLPLLALFVGSLAVEDQRHFLSCRQTGASADTCLLQISGR